MKPRLLRVFLLAWLLLDTGHWTRDTVFAVEPELTDALGFARADHLFRQGRYTESLLEFGQLSKNAQEDPAFQRQVEMCLAALYRGQRPEASAASAAGPVVQKLRVVRRKQDSDRNSDQGFDNRGWQVNEHFSAKIPARDGWKAHFVADLDGFVNGHNDLRPRTLLADFFRENSHIAFGDTATYMSPYFLRGSRLRGVNLIFDGPLNQFQAVGGAYPFWLEDRDEYIYPRSVFGIRDRWNVTPDRVWLSANLFNARDTGRVRTIDVANQPRDNIVFSLDQEVKVIPDVWFLRASEGYSTTDDNLLQDRFGDVRKLKDTAFQVESFYIHRFFRSRSRFERIGPDFRLLTDIPSGGVISSKSLTVDRQFIQQTLDFEPAGPFDLDLEASFIRNNLDEDDTVGHVRKSWYSAHLKILTPPGWIRPGIRSTLFDTVSVPAATTRPSQTRTTLTELELHQQLFGVDWSGFASYEAEHPIREDRTFDEEERWSLGARGARPVGERLLLSNRYRYHAFDELFNEVRQEGIRHEFNEDISLRLWSTANLSLGYGFEQGKIIHPRGRGLTSGERHYASAGFIWPYRWMSWDKRRKLSISPSLHYFRTDFTGDLSERSLVTSRLGVSYAKTPDWKVELLGEFRYDYDEDRDDLRGEDSRIWLLWTSRWN
ncbi:MAG: hypothetical protein HYZ90_00170 [Candidatus Omnitrophica bacterium]|nr:hypothetical protein [Candidatus Omnitrophota bacterium]